MLSLNNKYAKINKTPWLKPKHSWYFLIFLFLIYIGAGISTVIAAIPNAIQWIIIIMLLLHFIMIINQQFFLNSASSIIAFQFDGVHWWLQKRSGEMHISDLHGNSIITRYFLLLRFQDVLNQRYFLLFIFPDTLPTQTRRLLLSLINMHA